ncbi:unnamed protein product [Peniophora sp. CBMAI 1063]|nr:unnamed protein product [Peniophora sp. CBMAI 1063]
MSQHVFAQPLKGDEYGRFRVKISGNSGAGKSTLGAELARVLGVPFISLDAIYWLPGWQELPDDEFRAIVAATLDKAQGGWVVDGNYSRPLGDIVDGAATDIVWLDPPFLLYFPRLIWRTFRRLFRLEESCSDGCEESWLKTFFSRDSIIWWCMTNHTVVQARIKKFMAADDPSAGGPGKYIHLGGWGGEQDAWLRDVKAMARSK